MANVMIKPLDPQFRSTLQEILSDSRYMPHFKDCIGAIDGVHVQASISPCDQVPYIEIKGIPTQNVISICNFDMQFTFACAEWEGSAHDSRVLLTALRDPQSNFPKPPNGQTDNPTCSPVILNLFSSPLHLLLCEAEQAALFGLHQSPFIKTAAACFAAWSVKMYTTKKKIQKDHDAEPTEFEETVAQALFDLENTNQELKSDLKDLFINQATQMDVAGNRKAVVVYVPYRLRKAYRKVHVRLVRELEKKFSGKDVILIATRRIVRPPKKGSAVQRPRTRTLTAVHDAVLEDVVYPAEIVGKRVRYRLDGSKIVKIFLDPKERNNTEYKLETFSGVYRKITGKDVVFEFPITDA
ncbi:hypothetical protein Dsin_012215 [Dipteronia sinensis]|uniref:40S ribosomal protein S7 n=1 Tax=Dipteronia sinensis TaxID=43782 RepID=A0AAE0E978_9ROSI|nr:hypothetical protein Dsin_012215 [Dipteronia sinensis]